MFRSARSTGRPLSHLKWTANLQTEYDYPLGSGASSAFVRGLFTLVPNYKNNPANTLDNVKSYVTANLYTGLRTEDGGWEESLFVKNLFGVDRSLATGGNGFGGGTAPLTSSVRFFTGASSQVSSYYSRAGMPLAKLAFRPALLSGRAELCDGQQACRMPRLPNRVSLPMVPSDPAPQVAWHRVGRADGLPFRSRHQHSEA